MKRILAGCFLLVLIAFSACNDDGGQTRPTPTPQPPPVANPPPTSPTTTTPSLPPPTTDRWAKDSFEMKVVRNDGEAFGVTATNITKQSIHLRLSCYGGPPNDPASQEFFSSGGNYSVGPGSTAFYECPVACDAGQADLHEGPVLKPPVGFGRGLALGRATRGSGPRCEPPPPVCDIDKLRTSARQECGDDPFTLDPASCTFKCKPPVCDLECSSPFFLNSDECKCECSPELLREKAEDECEHGVLSVDPMACTFKCKPPKPPTCDELNPPRVENWTYSVNSTHITASFDCYNGACSADIWAGFPNNPNRWRKDPDDANPKCDDGKKHISVSYRHKNHSACLWRLEADGPGFSFSKNVINRCEDN